MSSYDFELDHIGIAVNSLEEGSAFYKALQLKEGHRETVDSEKVNVAFFPLKNNANLELLESTDSDGTIKKFIEKRGPGIHHICLRVKNLDQLVQHLKTNKVQLINEVPKLGAHNCRVVFIHPKSTGGVLIELSERGE